MVWRFSAVNSLGTTLRRFGGGAESAPVDDGDLDPVRPNANLVEFAGGADGAPQPSKAGAEDEDPLHYLRRVRGPRRVNCSAPVAIMRW